MRLQYSAMGSNGVMWINAQERFDEFVEKAAKFHGHTVDQIVNNGLLAGKNIPINTGWDATKIRDYDSIRHIKTETIDNRKLYTCSHCGQTGYAGSHPFSTISGGNVCDDCL